MAGQWSALHHSHSVTSINTATLQLQSTISKYLNLDIKIPTDILKNGFKQEKNLHKEDDKADTERDI